jgi:hypothetical protein
MSDADKPSTVSAILVEYVSKLQGTRNANTADFMKRITSPPSPAAPITDLNKEWLTPEEFAAEFPKIAHAYAIRRDVWQREALGLVTIDAVRKVGKRVLIHRHRYAAWRLGDLKAPSATIRKRPKRTPPDTSDT